MSTTPHDIVLIQDLIEGDRLGEALDDVGDALLEPSAPELALLLRRRRRERGLGLGRGGNHLSLRHHRSVGESERGKRRPTRELG